MLLKNELQSIISGTGHVAKGTAIQAAADYIRKSKTAGKNAEEKEFVKEQEAAALTEYCRQHNLFLQKPDETRYLAEGAEQKVYLDEAGEYVIKYNDTIFYKTWEDYFNSLLLHNYFFPSTYYELTGFLKDEEKLFAVVKQPYIRATDPTDESFIKELMTGNGFSNTRNNDYLSKSLGIIVEDLHDENVLTSKGVLFFIDTVFYLTEEFFIPA